MAVNRSPRYPAIDLLAAITMAGKIFDKEGRAPIKEEIAMRDAGYGGLNGASLKALSALRKYGLVENAAGGVKISQDAIVILANRSQPDNPDRLAAIRRAAFRVELFSDIHDDFGPDVSEANLAAQLVVRGFSQDGAVKAARAYRATMALVGSAEWEENPGDKRASDGTQELPMDDGETYAPPRTAVAPNVPLQNDEREWLRGALSRGTNYRLVVSGEIGPKQIGKLIKLLQAQQAVLEDDDEDDASEFA